MGLLGLSTQGYMWKCPGRKDQTNNHKSPGRFQPPAQEPGRRSIIAEMKRQVAATSAIVALVPVELEPVLSFTLDKPTTRLLEFLNAHMSTV